MKIYAFIGVIGSGKDFYAKKKMTGLEQEGLEVAHVNFADAIREMTWNIFQFRPENEEEYEKFKKSKIQVCMKNNPTITGRRFMQAFATDFFRDIDPLFWIKAWDRQVERCCSDCVVVSDCRFENEAQWLLRHHDVRFIFCNYKSKRYEINDHVSEKFAQLFLEEQDQTDITEKIKRRFL